MFRDRIFLSGVDYFQLLIDHHARKKGAPGHQAHLAVYLEGFPGEEEIKAVFSGDDQFRKIASIRLSKTWGLGYPSIKFCDPSSVFPVTFHDETGSDVLPERYLTVSVNPYRESPVKLQVVRLAGSQTCLLFTFSHILFDFSGVRSFVRTVAGENKFPLLPEPQSRGTFTERFERFFKGVFFAFREGNGHMSFPERQLPAVSQQKVVYHETEFTTEETRCIYENIRQLNLGSNPSVYFVAAAALALHREIFSKQRNHKFFWIPLPVNNRKKGRGDAMLFNGLTFLFIKLFPHQLQSASATASVILHQIRDQVREQLPEAFIDFSDGYWYVPMPFYYPMMQLPSEGKLSSFSISTLGNTFNIDELFGCRVTNMINYPSNSASPGITFLFYEYRSKLRIMTSWIDGQYTSAEHESVVRAAGNILLKRTE